MARFGSLPTSTPAAAPAAAPAAPAKPATPATQTAPAAPAGPAKPKTPAPKTPKSPYSAESEAIFGSKPGTLSIEERFSPGQAESLRAAGLLGPADTAALGTSMADTDFYLKKLQAVEALRKQGVLGLEDPSRFGGRVYETEAEPVPRSAKIPFTIPSAPGRPPVTVLPDPSKVYFPGSEMDRIANFRTLAQELGQSYRTDAEAATRGEQAIARAERDPNFDRRKLPDLAKQQRELYRRLAASRASLREMGFMDDQEVQEKFLK